LKDEFKNRIRNYDLPFEELSGYSEKDIRDIFTRMNKYVVTLSPQELRHAREQGAFKKFAERVGRMPFWRQGRIFSDLQMRRMRHVEYAAELAILLTEGPQDKKRTVDLYYRKFRSKFPFAKSVESRLRTYTAWISNAVPDLRRHRFRKPVDLYALIGALDEMSARGRKPSGLPSKAAGKRLLRFEEQTLEKEPVGDAAKYVLAASRQTDNIGPRTTRIQVLTTVLRA